MAYLLRAVEDQLNWEKACFPSWLPPGCLPSQVIVDLRANGNSLSLWEIPDGQGTVIEQVAAAIASMRAALLFAVISASGCAMPKPDSPTATPVNFSPKSKARTVPCVR